MTWKNGKYVYSDLEQAFTLAAAWRRKCEKYKAALADERLLKESYERNMNSALDSLATAKLVNETIDRELWNVTHELAAAFKDRDLWKAQSEFESEHRERYRTELEAVTNQRDEAYAKNGANYAAGRLDEQAKLREPVADEEVREALAHAENGDWQGRFCHPFCKSCRKILSRALRSTTAKLKEAEAKIADVEIETLRAAYQKMSWVWVNAKIAALEKKP